MDTPTPEEYRQHLDAMMRRAFLRGRDGDRAIVEAIPLDAAEERRTLVARRALMLLVRVGVLPGLSS